MKIKTFNTKKTDLSVVVSELKSNIGNNPSLILFFASTVFDFSRLSKELSDNYPKSEVVGVTTTGEIGPSGFEISSLSIMSFEGVNVKAVLMKDIAKYPIFYRDQLIDSLKSVGINPNSEKVEQEGLGLVFPCGLVAAEEKMLAVVNSIFKKEGFPLFGGTAGDDAKFENTFVSHNGVSVSSGGVAIFIKNDNDIVMQKENIFVPTGKKIKITKADTEKRIVYEMNGRKANTEYARLLGVSESQLGNYFMTNPVGRQINDEVWIASPFQILEDGSIQFYCQIFQDSVVEILEPKNATKTLEESVQNFKGKFEKLDGVLAINCILRKLQFENQNIISVLNNHLKTLPNLSGFSSYGEQMGKTQLNQTLILLGFGKKKLG